MRCGKRKSKATREGPGVWNERLCFCSFAFARVSAHEVRTPRFFIPLLLAQLMPHPPLVYELTICHICMWRVFQNWGRVLFVSYIRACVSSILPRPASRVGFTLIITYIQGSSLLLRHVTISLGFHRLARVGK